MLNGSTQPSPPPAPSTRRAVIRAVRLEQWIKNALVFVPMVLKHRVNDPAVWLAGLTAFVALGCVASAGYLVNDLRDREHDRLHPSKRLRPIASGAVPASTAIGGALGLAAIGVVLAVTMLPSPFSWVLAAYGAGTTAYSLGLKRVEVLDVLVLAGLFVLRLSAGGAATDVALSPWLLTFAMFVFLSLAVVKRYGELALIRAGRAEGSPGRGYRVGDADLLRSVGVAAGTVSVVVLALYVMSDDVRVLYHRPTLLLLVCPALLFWVLRIWMLADRGELDDDPLVFTMRDPLAWATAAGVLAMLWLAA
jgi:4-hydroxybenzoate polyprenyltransferase